MAIYGKILFLGGGVVNRWLKVQVWAKRNKLLEVLRVQNTGIGLKINVKKTKSQRHKFIYLGSIISKDGGNSEDVTNRIAKAQCVFPQLKKKEENLENRKICLQTKIRILEATGMTVVKHG